MNQKNENDGFSFSYSPLLQEEIKSIRDKYLPKEETVIDKVRKIDNAITRNALIISLIFGIVGALILGFGMSLIMTELAEAISLNDTAAMVLGIISGILGGALAALAYPSYIFTLKKGREKAAPEIIRLTDDLIDK